MKKYDNFISCLNVLKRADYAKVADDEIYRAGYIAQFNLSFELAWKVLQETLKLYLVSEAESASPREILKLAYSKAFIRDSEIWLLMLRKRNASIHVYDGQEADELTILIRDSFVKALDELVLTLEEKIKEAESIDEL